MSTDNLPTTEPVAKKEPTKPTSSGIVRIHPSVTFIVILVVLVYLFINAWIYFYGTKILDFNLGLKNVATSVSVIKEQGFSQLPGPSPKPKPKLPPRTYYPLPSGTQAWDFSYGPAAKGPKPLDATVDPLTPDKGANQTVSITVKYTDPVTSATATEFTDNGSNVHPLLLTSGTATDGVWSGSWPMPDTYAHTYHINFLIQSATGNWSGALMFR